MDAYAYLPLIRRLLVFSLLPLAMPSCRAPHDVFVVLVRPL